MAASKRLVLIGRLDLLWSTIGTLLAVGVVMPLRALLRGVAPLPVGR